METYTAAKPFVDDPGFAFRRAKSLKGLDLNSIDPPIVDIIDTLSHVAHCFTLQCCWGHFVHDGQPSPHGIAPLANYADTTTVEYRIAYMAMCIQNSPAGLRFYNDLKRIVQIDSKYIQFASADWFWNQHVNSYIIQTEPDRFKTFDTAKVAVAEALHLQSIRNRMYEAIGKICNHHKT
ncbi:MAG: hypothetical protein JW763_04355 [candidate division Zixibacteria bacterium]|nr:hypothetical protein [candidate division Zixibacteria bacterium]